MSDKVYAGGVPEHGVKLHPGKDMSGEGDEWKLLGELGVKTSNGGPATSSGNKTRDFLNDKGYDAGSLEAGRPGGVKVVNPDDISHSA